MADLLKNVWGGGQKNAPAAQPDSDFADFAGAPDPVPEAAPGVGTPTGTAAVPTTVPFTKWYNVHERHSLSEFKSEGYIIGIAAFIFLLHAFGARRNRSKAKAWIRAHAPVLNKEYALVGFGAVPTVDADIKPDSLIKEKSLFEFASYASGRQNTAFTDIKLTLQKRFNPMVTFAEYLFSFIFEGSMDPPSDYVEVFTYPFDGKEQQTVPRLPASAEIKEGKSAYDAFVWAVVNKSSMQKLREKRYDVSITSTKDTPKLPNWLTVMSESAEITDTLLTKELAAAIENLGDSFEYLIISDQPTDKPTTLDEARTLKRIFLKYRLPSDNNYDSILPLFSYFLRIPDILVESAHFRPEVTKKVRATREGLLKDLKKVAEEEKNEERQLEREKAKKAKRDADLKGLDAKAQKKYLEKEKEKEMRKAAKKQTVRG
jgi:hypothetical protein